MCETRVIRLVYSKDIKVHFKGIKVMLIWSESKEKNIYWWTYENLFSLIFLSFLFF